MRIPIILLAAAAGLAAQVPEADASAKLKQFERNLQNALRPSGGVTVVEFVRPPERACAMPLRNVGPDPSFQSNTPAIVPERKIAFAARQIAPPAPACEEQTKK